MVDHNIGNHLHSEGRKSRKEICLSYVSPVVISKSDMNLTVADIATIEVDDFVLLFGCNILAEDDLTMEENGIEGGATLGLVIDEPEMKVGAGDGFQKDQQCVRVGASCWI